MRLMGWSKEVESYHAIQDVPARVRKTEIAYWCFLFMGVAILVQGLFMMHRDTHAPWGLFLALSGIVQIALIKLWVHIRLAMYQIILEMREMRKNG
ncbi:MAG: hypothetical protein V1929_12130 [bacterium]